METAKYTDFTENFKVTNYNINIKGESSNIYIYIRTFTEFDQYKIEKSIDIGNKFTFKGIL
jgi:hypothetical protein